MFQNLAGFPHPHGCLTQSKGHDAAYSIVNFKYVQVPIDYPIFSTLSIVKARLFVFFFLFFRYRARTWSFSPGSASPPRFAQRSFAEGPMHTAARSGAQTAAGARSFSGTALNVSCTRSRLLPSKARADAVSIRP
jgi:hypothetical protein